MSEKLVQKLKVIAANKVSSDSATAKIITEAAELIEKHNLTSPVKTQNVDSSQQQSKYTDSYNLDDLFKTVWGTDWEDFFNDSYKKTNEKKSYYYNTKQTFEFDIDTIAGYIFSKKFKKKVKEECELLSAKLVTFRKTDLFTFTIEISHPYSGLSLTNVRKNIDKMVKDGWWILL